MAKTRDKATGDAMADLNPAQQALVNAVRQGWSAKVPGLVKDMTPAERRGCLPALTALRREVREKWDGTNWRSLALIIAGAACHTAPSGAAQWISSTGNTAWTKLWLSDDVVHLVAVLSQQDPEWIADVATRLAERRASAWDWPQFPLIERLLLLADCPIPTSDAFVTTWMQWSATRFRARPWDTLVIRNGEVVTDDTDPKGTPRGTVIDGRVIVSPRRSTLVDRLRTDPFLDALVPMIFEAPDTHAQLIWWGHNEDYQWPQALATLAAEGRLDRDRLIDACLSRLLRGDRATSLRGFLAILAELAPTLDEQAARATTYLRLLPDSHSTVAGIAQQALITLDGEGRLDPEILIEASRMVLCRPEKKLVRAQLSWLDRAARRDTKQGDTKQGDTKQTDAGRCGEIVLAAAEAFANEDSAIAERALTIVARHHLKAGDAVRPDLLAAVATLNPTLHAQAVELLGIADINELANDPSYDEPADLLPPVPEPRPLATAPTTPEEVAEDVAAILVTPSEDVDVATLEQALDGLVRHAHRDREALAAALKPIRNPQAEGNTLTHWEYWGAHNIGHVVAAVTGDISIKMIRRALLKKKNRKDRSAPHQHPFFAVMETRLMEVAAGVVTDPPPFLLATPSYATGRIDPDVLVGRLRAYEEAGVEPGEIDLDQALLRVGRDAAPDVLAEADRLTSPAGQRLATWLRLGGLPEPETKWVVQPSASKGHQPPIGVRAPGIAPPVQMSPVFDRLFHVTEAEASWGHHVQWASILPEHRELAAAHMMDVLADGAGVDQYRASRLLPALAEAGGPAGLAVHLGLAYALGGKTREWRTAAVDALLVLAARGDLDPATLGRCISRTLRLDAVKPNRLAESMREASRTGAYATVWSVLAATLPKVFEALSLPDPQWKPGPGLADVVAVAAECALRSGTRGPIEEITAFADQRGSSRLVKEARVLRDALARP